MATQITSAVAIAPRKVRITFNAATNVDGTALAPANYALTPSGSGPFYTPVVVSAADSAAPPTTTPTIVDVTLDQEPTPVTLYTITATGVTGVVVDGVHNIAFFWPLVPAAPSERDFAIIDVIPTINIADDTSGELANFVACLQEVANLLWSDIDRWGNIYDIDKSPDNFVDLILTQLGNPVELPDLTVAEKRKLCSMLVAIYKIKGSLPGIKAAIKFFVGLPAQVSNFYGMGFLLGATGVYPGTDGTDLGTWILGAGDPFAITIKCGTPGGVALSAAQLARVTEIVNKTKPSVSHIQAINASFVAPARADIKDNGAGSVTITCAAVTGATAFQIFGRSQPGVNEWNGTATALVGTGPAALTYTPGATLYWVACEGVPTVGIPGLITNEVTNALTTPVLTATPQTRNIHLSWPAVSGATSYRIYKSLAAHGKPSAMDNASNPIRVNGTISGAQTYDDPMETGLTFYYIVVPLAADSEGFYSNEVHTTAT
jgi:phage tail-like protein